MTLNREACYIELIKNLFFMSFVALQACDQTDEHSSAVPDAKPTLSIPGWIRVDFGISATSLENHKGKMYESYDEYIGHLFDNGLRLDASYWYKPTYGNQNILWTNNPDIGIRNYKQLSQKKLTGAFPQTETEADQLTVDEHIWHYAGNRQTIVRSEHSETLFQDYVFYCQKSSDKGVSVFYWGEEIQQFPWKDETMLGVLKSLSIYCE